MSSFFESIFRTAGRLSLNQMLIICAVIVVGSIVTVRLSTTEEVAATPEATTTLPQVTLTSLAEQSESSTVSLIGTVRADAEAAITAEVSGQVTAAPVTLGMRVQAGQVIATLENRSERAAVTQAEGVYDAAVASASQNNLSLENAELAYANSQRQAVTTVKSAYNTVTDVFRNQIDTFYRQPDGISRPGIRISGDTKFLSETRVAFRDILEEWQAAVDNTTVSSDIEAALNTARTNTEKTLTLVDAFLRALDLSDNRDNANYNIPQEKAEFTNMRTQLLALLDTIEDSESALVSAKIQIEQAEQGTVGGTNSSADAQIKQALGSLQAAQANLAKTILRSPIAGTITTLDVRTGSFVSAGTAIATVANTNTLEIITFAGARERDRFAVGDIVRLDGDLTGRVAAISPTINDATGKTEIRIYSDSADLTSGDSVRITTTADTAVTTAPTTYVPITAIKFTADRGAVLTVDADNIAREQAIELGAIRAGQVEIRAGLSTDDRFISDARGITPGDEVTVTN